MSNDTAAPEELNVFSWQSGEPCYSATVDRSRSFLEIQEPRRPVGRFNAVNSPRRRLAQPQGRKMKTVARAAALVAVVVLSGCQYYEISDPSSGRTYITDNWHLDDRRWREGGCGRRGFWDKAHVEAGSVWASGPRHTHD